MRSDATRTIRRHLGACRADVATISLRELSLATQICASRTDLTDQQWDLIGRFLPELPRRHDGRGRPWRENRPVLDGILWILRTGAPWADLPARYPSHQTCHRRFQRWVRAGALRTVLEILAQALHDEGYLDLQEAFIDGSFAPAKRGGTCVGETKRGKGSKIMAIADRQERPVSVYVESATSGCSTWPAASFCCGVYEMASSYSPPISTRL